MQLYMNVYDLFFFFFSFLPLSFSPLFSHPTTIHIFPTLPWLKEKYLMGKKRASCPFSPFHFDLRTRGQVKRPVFPSFPGRNKVMQVLCSYELWRPGHCSHQGGQACAQRTQELGHTLRFQRNLEANESNVNNKA